MMSVKKDLFLSQKQKIICIFSVIITAGLFYLANWRSPMVGDDYPIWYFSETQKSFESVHNLIGSMEMYYYGSAEELMKTGRMTGFFFALLFCHAGKSTFNMANTLVYMLFMFLMYAHIKGTFRKFNILLFIAINLGLWFFTPSWGEDFLWLTGSCMILWTGALLLLFLLPFRKKMMDSSYKMPIPLSLLWFVVGIIAGCNYENSAAAALVFLTGYFIIKKIRKEKIEVFEIIGAAGFLIGVVILLGAPAEHARLRATEIMYDLNSKSWLLRIFEQFVRANKKLLSTEMYLLAAPLLAFLLKKTICNGGRGREDKTPIFIWAYFAASFAGIYSMTLSPSFMHRACFIPVVFFIITLFLIADHSRLKTGIKDVPDLITNNIKLISALVLIGFFGSYIAAFQKMNAIYKIWEERTSYVSAQKAKGVLNIELEITQEDNLFDKHCVAQALPPDVSIDPAVNKPLAHYYGVETIKGFYKSKSP